MLSNASATSDALRANFRYMGLVFAVNHGVATAPLMLASSVLGKDLGNVGNGVFYCFALSSALLFAVPIVSTLGPKAGLVAGSSLYSCYISCFALVQVMTGEWRWPLWIFASACGGMGGGVLWTAQGRYFAATATLISEGSGEGRDSVTARLSGSFSMVYLLLEVTAKLGFTGLQETGLPDGVIAAAYGACAIAASVLMSRTTDLKSQTPCETAPPFLAQVTGAMSLWPDPLVWLLAPTNLTFGFSAAFMNGYVNGSLTKEQIGENVVMFFGAFTCVVAAASAALIGRFGSQVNKGWFITLGAVAFFCIPLSLLSFGVEGWGWWLLVLYLCQGLGRSVYESVNRAMFADFYPGAQTANAFANCALQANTASACGFFLQAFLTKEYLVIIVMCLAGATPLSYALAALLRSRRQQREGLLAGNGTQ